ncbi:hypothetical protein ACVWXO_001054 [Bradyrhizobium sp. LM2.7]
MKAHQRKLDIRNGCVDLSHGSGGRAMSQLISGLFHEAFGNEWLACGNDQSAFDVGAGRMVMTTDGYVVSPLFFPGGNYRLARRAWHGQRHRHGRRAAPLSLGELHHRGRFSFLRPEDDCGFHGRGRASRGRLHHHR